MFLMIQVVHTSFVDSPHFCMGDLDFSLCCNLQNPISSLFCNIITITEHFMRFGIPYFHSRQRVKLNFAAVFTLQLLVRKEYLCVFPQFVASIQCRITSVIKTLNLLYIFLFVFVTIILAISEQHMFAWKKGRGTCTHPEYED